MSEEQKKQIKINFPKEIVGGTYANNLMVQHSHDEFILDFMMIAPPAGTVVSRVVTSPAQAKRIAHALQDNIAKYEQKHGEIPVKEQQANVDFNLYTKQ